jgi:putative ABC transport system ATP-binding protein
MLGCLDTPTEGTVRIDGEPIGRLADRQLSLIRRNRIGFVFQQYYLNECMTAQQNVLLPLELAKVKDRKKKAGEALAWVGLGHKVKAYPSELSGGEQQRCAIARALANSPEIVLADEPTGCLDIETGEKIMGVLTDLNEEQEIGIVVVTHDEMIASSAREQIQVRDGRIS